MADVGQTTSKTCADTPMDKRATKNVVGIFYQNEETNEINETKRSADDGR